jgi:hypothetical protein
MLIEYSKIVFAKGESKIFSDPMSSQRNDRQDKLFERKAQVFVMTAERDDTWSKKDFELYANTISDISTKQMRKTI